MNTRFSYTKLLESQHRLLEVMNNEPGVIRWDPELAILEEESGKDASIAEKRIDLEKPLIHED